MFPIIVGCLSLFAPLPLRPVRWLARGSRVHLCEPPEPPIAPGWLTTDSGLCYTDDTVGNGELPSAGSVVQVAYSGELLSDGRKVSFMGASGSGQSSSPLTFVLGGSESSAPAVLQATILAKALAQS